MNRIYLDHASTSFPKAPGVAQAMMDYLTLNGAAAAIPAHTPQKRSFMKPASFSPSCFIFQNVKM